MTIELTCANCKRALDVDYNQYNHTFQVTPCECTDEAMDRANDDISDLEQKLAESLAINDDLTDLLELCRPSCPEVFI